MAALGRTHAFIAGWALTLGYPCVVALNASVVTLVFRVTFPELVMRGALSVRFQFFAVVLMIVAVVVIVASIVIYYVAKRPGLTPAFPADVPPAAAVATIMAFVPWAYVGFDSIPTVGRRVQFLAEESARPSDVGNHCGNLDLLGDDARDLHRCGNQSRCL